MKTKLYLLLICLSFALTACPSPHGSSKNEIKYNEVTIQKTASVVVPKDGDTPVAGVALAEKPSQTLTFSKIGEKFSVKYGEVVNIIYDGVDPEDTFIMYESTMNGYDLILKPKNETHLINFTYLCQQFVVLNPDRTLVAVPGNLRYEQVIWTPRSDGTWEVRLGSTDRGCKSPALNDLNKLRTKEYQNSIPKGKK